MFNKLIFQPFGTKVEVQEGKTVLQAAQQAGVHIPAYCGGEKTCGKCRIKVVEGSFEKHQIYSSGSHLSPVTEEERKLFTEQEIQSGYRLACMTQIKGDAVVEIPPESQLQRQKILEHGQNKDIAQKPAVKTYYLELDKATLADHRDDLSRVKAALRGYEELDESLDIDFAALKQLSKTIREGAWKITVFVLYDKKIIGVAPGRVEKYYGAAVDIGTTTVVAYICDMRTGQVVHTGSFINPQVRYGDDVISRITYCMANENGVKTLKDLLIDELNETFQRLALEGGFSADEICEVVLVFNTVMESIALGISPDALGVSPFVSAVSGALDIPARELGINIMPGGNLHCLPSEAGFVGADNVAVLISEEPYHQDKMQLIIDIGTNSEICLGNKDKLYTTSCATGPALEGAQIKCGMRAARGAIESVEINPVTLEPRLKIIGDDNQQLSPVGICGSGILDVVVQMAVTGILEPDGRFSQRIESERVRLEKKGQKEYVLYFKKTAQERDIVVTIADVRAVQLAKAALYAGAKTLMTHCGITSVDQIVLAGGFGSYINKESALKLGLFPDCNYNNISVAGNAAGVGARLALCNTDKRTEAEMIARKVEFIETASEAGFSKNFTQAMIIPHKQDAFTMNKPMAFHCPGIHAAGKGTVSSEYPFKDPDEFLEKIDASLTERIEQLFISNARENLPKDLIDIQGPFAVLSNLVSPEILYSYGRKRPETLENTLLLITNEMVAYAKAALAKGVKIISYADPAGELEQVGMKYYRQFSGKYNQVFFKKLEESLKEAIVHLCGKTSCSMEKAGYILARPYRMEANKNYMEILYAEAKIHKVKFIGHACINKKQQTPPILYRLELT